MARYVIPSRFSPEAFGDPKEFKKLAHEQEEGEDEEDEEEEGKEKRKEEEEEEKWQITHSTTETLVATPWKEFLEIL